jgi:hypothetical protein
VLRIDKTFVARWVLVAKVWDVCPRQRGSVVSVVSIVIFKLKIKEMYSKLKDDGFTRGCG